MTSAGLAFRVDDATGRLFVGGIDPGRWHDGDESRLTAALAEAGFGEWAIDPREMAVLLEAMGDAEAELTEREFPIARRMDGSFRLTLDARKHTATLLITPPRGGAAVNEEVVRQAIAQQSIVHGLDEGALVATVQAGRMERSEAVIARATPPIHGRDTEFESLIPEARRRMPHIDERGRADYRDLGEVPQVSPGTPLMRRHPATSGTHGTNLLGQVIPARPGREFPFAAVLRNVAPTPDDPALLVATIAGAPVVVPRGVIVEESLQVDKVDLSSGNLSFEGSVLIRGDVVSGMKVTASGDIIVNGMVEGAVLEAGGDIQVRHGVVGQLHLNEQQDGKAGPTASLKAGGTVTAHFLENARVQAAQVVVQEQVFHCRINATYSIVVGSTAARKGQIVGGVVRAGELIECRLLGSPAAPHTQVVAGVDPELRDQFRALEQRIEQQTHLAEELSRSLHFAKLHPERVAADFLRRADNTLVEAQGHIRELELGKESLLAQMGRSEGACILVRQRIYPGVEVWIGDRPRRIESESVGGVFHLREGELFLDHTPS
ncbi:DUF342 domain-containing protein [Ectothiorhodospira lacustris]|uniref:DUF342 domain-containing protein n=1 Tax=Ectothiorhodospira lacustris TaxID=2899127 RepID=UPI001EE88141|nr:FapA family protein [Ectothiorhodospira lacustris]MCG5500940.1 FapA family protein [Ectothiorhodospira lacustris]MCG5510697.1 FapA family protein [Ectothiorhodospira lacustris]MCG5522403.1 FapA family protein [Ectothiorhodospira lacustris]